MHHHSIGISKSNLVSKIKGLILQEIFQYPNDPRIASRINERLVAAAAETPKFLELPLADVKENFDEMAEKLAAGRFILHLWSETADEAKRFLKKLKKSN